MRATYIPANEKFWIAVITRQQRTQFGGSGGFTGIRYQRGAGLGSFFASLFRSLLPAAKSIGKSAVKAIGKKALSTGAKIASDVASGRNFKEAAKEHGEEAAHSLLTQAATKLTGAQTGTGLGKRKKAKHSKHIKRRKTSTMKDIFVKYSD